MGSIPCGDCLSSCSVRLSSGSTDLSLQSSSSPCPCSGRSSSPSSPSSMSGSSDPSSRLSRLSLPYLKGSGSPYSPPQWSLSAPQWGHSGAPGPLRDSSSRRNLMSVTLKKLSSYQASSPKKFYSWILLNFM